MAIVGEYRAIWNVPGGGTGFSVMHFTGVDTSIAALQCADALRAFFQSLATRLPNEVQITFDNEFKLLDAANGQLQDVFPILPPTTVSGSNSGSWAGGAGGRVVWDTGVIVAGRRLRGRTFLVPLANAFDSAGTLATDAISAIGSAADTLLASIQTASASLAVWGRAAGVVHPVVLASVPDRTAILRSRRDA